MDANPYKAPSWMRFRLRTLLVVVAVFAIAFGWFSEQWRIVANRRSIGRSLEQTNQAWVIWERIAWGEPVERFIEGDKSRPIGYVRRWLGDENVSAIIFFSPDSDKRSAIEAFPEADVYFDD